jgi:hypothetical protein
MIKMEQSVSSARVLGLKDNLIVERRLERLTRTSCLKDSYSFSFISKAKPAYFL